jgi:hypothetical protein
MTEIPTTVTCSMPYSISRHSSHHVSEEFDVKNVPEEVWWVLCLVVNLKFGGG